MPEKNKGKRNPRQNDDVLQEREDLLQAKEASHEKKLADFKQKEKGLAEQEKLLAEKINQWEEGRTQRDAKAKKDSEREAELSDRESDSKKTAQALEKRAKELGQLETNLIDREREVLEKENAAISGFAQQNYQSLKNLEQSSEKLRDEIVKLEADRIEAMLRAGKEIGDWKQSQMREFEKERAAERKQFEDDIAARRKALENDLSKQQDVANQLQDSLQQIAFYKHECERLEKRLKQLEAEKLSLRGMSQTDAANYLKDLETRMAELEKELASRPSRTAADKTKELEASLQVERDSRYMLEGKLNKLYAEVQSKNIQEVTLERMRDECEAYQANINVLRTITEKKHQEYDALLTEIKGSTKSSLVTEETEEYKRRLGDINMSRFSVRSSLPKIPAEKAWLNTINSRMRQIGLIYPRRILNAFHTCLKISDWAPLTVLAGVSGTGKSELPSKYALFGGLHFEMVPVQPNWDSPEQIFGFFNYLDGRFNAKPLLRAMAQSQRDVNKDGGFSNQLLLVLLDEMNLSRVEQYLSDLLSKWEARRGKTGVSVEFDLGANCEKFKLMLGRNVLFAGTINEDETTQTLSPKVLDRGNLLYFPRPDQLHSRDTLNEGEAPKALAVEHWISWIKEPAFLQNEAEQLRSYQLSLQEINQQLARVQRGLGHRVWQAMAAYLANHPDVIEAVESQKKEKIQLHLTQAFEDQLVQRVIPKLRGIELRSGTSKNCLEEIRKQIFEHAPGLIKDFDEAKNDSSNTFMWRESSYLTMKEEETEK
jgi:hypothetical protein